MRPHVFGPGQGWWRRCLGVTVVLCKMHMCPPFPVCMKRNYILGISVSCSRCPSQSDDSRATQSVGSTAGRCSSRAARALNSSDRCSSVTKSGSWPAAGKSGASGWTTSSGPVDVPRPLSVEVSFRLMVSCPTRLGLGVGVREPARPAEEVG